MMQTGRTVKAAALLLCVIHLAGCTASIPLRENDGATLPPPSQPYQAPRGDAGDSAAQDVLLSLPSSQSGQLEMFPDRAMLSRTRHPAEGVLKRLFSYAETTQALPLNKEIEISLMPGSPVEISGDTAVVNLSASALALSNLDRYLALRAITNTLTQWGDIRYVNVLISGRQLGVNTAANIPPGSLIETTNEEALAHWEAITRQAPGSDLGVSAIVTLYFPALLGHGILAEARTLALRGDSLSDLSVELLSALSAGAAGLPNVPRLPDLVTLLSAPVQVEEQPGSAGRIISLRFHESANQALISSGIPRSVLMASLTYTLTTFLPYTAGIKVMIGSEQINAVVPSGVFEGAGEEILFEGGVMQRYQFSHFLLDNCSLYFVNPLGGLSETLRPVPYYQTYNPRYLVNQLMAGPQTQDSKSGLKPILPQGMRDADLFGITQQSDTALVNFSSNLLQLTAGMDETQKQLMVYGMVNALTALPGIKRVRFYIDNEQTSVFSTKIDLVGEFLRNEGIIRQE